MKKLHWPRWFTAQLIYQDNISRLVAEGLTLGYNQGAPVQSQLNVEFKRGILHAVIGENGSGKTCLLKTLAGITKPIQGAVSLWHDNAYSDPHADESVKPHRREPSGSLTFHAKAPPPPGQMTKLACTSALSLPFEQRALWQGYVEQKARIHWNLRVDEVVLLGASARRDRSVAEQQRAAIKAVVACGLTELQQRSVLELSAGEQQRVMLARIIAAEPNVLLVDEPTAGLDPRYQNTIMQLLRQQAESGKIVITVMHDIDLVRRYCDRVLVLEKCKEIAPGAGLRFQSEKCKEIAPGAGLHFGAVDEVLTPELLQRVFGIG